MDRSAYRRMFAASALWNLGGGVVALVFKDWVFGFSGLTPPDPPIWYYCWIALFMTFGVAMLSANRDMRRNIAFVPVGIAGKISFSIIYLYFYLARPGTVPSLILIGVAGDLIFSALYASFIRDVTVSQRLRSIDGESNGRVPSSPADQA